MLVPALFAGIAVALLVATLATRLSTVSLALTVLVVGYVFGYDVWHADAGPIPLTLDRLALVGLVGLAGWRWWRGELPTPRPIGLDMAIALVCGWLTLSCVMSRPGDSVTLPTSPLFRLVVSFWAPACLYAVLRTTKIGATLARRLLLGVGALGLYLGFTALCETAGVWSLVFPRYIADPDLGLHFGRARGPALNSVSLGVYLGVCATAAWLLVPRSSRPLQLVWLVGSVLMSFGVLLTYTRSTWIGLAGAAVTVICLQLPREWRRTAFVSAVVAGVLFLAVGKDALVGLEREDSGSVSAHSVQQRTAFAYVSMQMFRDHPLGGVGFGRFYDKKLPYLTDRRQSFELESLRELHHHNTFLSLLTETGLLGLFAYLVVLAGFARVGWLLAHDSQAPAECQRLGLLLIGTVMVYFPSALFHDLTLVHSDQWLLFTIAGAATGCWVHRAAAETVRQPAAVNAESLPARNKLGRGYAT